MSASTSVPRGLDPAIGCSTAEPAFTLTNASGDEPTTEKGPSSSKKLSRYMYGLGFIALSIRYTSNGDAETLVSKR